MAIRCDLRLQLFARLFALGTISHELEFLLEQSRIGPLTEYMERWSHVVPSVGWSSRTGLALHFANVAVSLLILILPWSRELLCLLAVTFLGSEPASPERIASHCSMMAGALLIILALGLAEWIEGALQRTKHASASRAWYAWTLVGLKSICALTYFFAFFYKLNPGWFSSAGRAAGFLTMPLNPLLDLLGMPDTFRRLLASISIYGTLVIEFSLPVLLLMRRTRLLGCLIGLIFSLGMIAQGVGNFPVLIVAFYPAFLSLAQTRELVERCLARPTVARIIATVMFAAVWFIQRGPKVNWMYHHNGLPKYLMVPHTVLAFACFVPLIYVAVTIAGWLSERRSEPENEPPEVEARDDEASSRVVAVVAGAAVVLVSAGFVYDNLAGFFAFPEAGALIMFSGISADLGNHYLLPRTPLIDSYDYVSVTRFESTDNQNAAAEEFGFFVRWLNGQPRPHQVNLNLVRYHLSRICNSSPTPSVQVSIRKRGGETLDFNNACTSPEMLWYVPLSIASACTPGCNGELTRWARDQPPN